MSPDIYAAFALACLVIILVPGPTASGVSELVA